MIFEGSGWKVNVVLGLFQVDWDSALLQIVTLWSVMVVLWKKRHKILVFSINNQWNNSDVGWTMRSTSQSDWVVVVVIEMIDEMYAGAGWTKK